MQTKEICWNITTNCNQSCKYCHRFLRINELTLKQNIKILKELFKTGITDITWTGGEALLYNGIDELLKISYNMGIKNNLVTNGLLLTQKRLNKIYLYLNNITLSLDSTDDEINENLGRGKKHFDNVNNVLVFFENYACSPKIRINSVANLLNINKFDELIKYLNRYNVNCWRIFKFIPLRETSIINKNCFDITNSEFKKVKQQIQQTSNVKKIEFRIQDDLEKKYVLIVANGDIIITNNGIDNKFGNVLENDISDLVTLK